MFRIKISYTPQLGFGSADQHQGSPAVAAEETLPPHPLSTTAPDRDDLLYQMEKCVIEGNERAALKLLPGIIQEGPPFFGGKPGGLPVGAVFSRLRPKNVCLIRRGLHCAAMYDSPLWGFRPALGVPYNRLYQGEYLFSPLDSPDHIDFCHPPPPLPGCSGGASRGSNRLQRLAVRNRSQPNSFSEVGERKWIRGSLTLFEASYLKHRTSA
jgi:hypothetical protein